MQTPENDSVQLRFGSRQRQMNARAKHRQLSIIADILSQRLRSVTNELGTRLKLLRFRGMRISLILVFVALKFFPSRGCCSNERPIGTRPGPFKLNVVLKKHTLAGLCSLFVGEAWFSIMCVLTGCLDFIFLGNRGESNYIFQHASF